MAQITNMEIIPEETNTTLPITAPPGDGTTAAENSATITTPEKPTECGDGTIRLGSIKIPHLVASQLRAQGYAIESYTEDEILQAIDACKIDGTLIEDHADVSFKGRLSLTPGEVAARHTTTTDVKPHKQSWVDRTNSSETKAHENFVSMIKSERENPDEQIHHHTAA